MERISFSNVQGTTLTASCGAASDTGGSLQSKLKYKLVYKTTNNLSTVSEAETDSLVAMDWTENTLTSHSSSPRG